MTDRIRDFFSLGFAVEPESQEIPLMLGKRRRGRRQKLLWEVAAWLLVAFGIFLRKALDVKHVDMVLSEMTLTAFLASAIIALATFPLFMRWLNRRRPRVGLGHIATPFAYGFFLDMAAVSVLKFAPKLLW